MSWYSDRINYRLEQEQLDSLQALIEDAMHDIRLWLQADPSAEERTHVLAVQERLADLDRIVARRKDYIREPKDDWVWSETVDDIKSHLERAGERRGCIVGKGLARIGAHLPQELLGGRRPLVSKAITPVGGLGSAAQRRKSTQVPPNAPANFPLDLWLDTGVILDESCARFPTQTQTLELCKHVVSEMTPLFCKAVKTGKMEGYAVFHQGLGGMEDLLHSLLVYNCEHDNERFRMAAEVRNSEEWRESRRAIAAIANVSGEPGVSVASGKPTGRRAIVDAYIEEVFRKKGERITRKDIWRQAGYQTRTEFERWERQDQRYPNQTADENFSRVLREKPHLK
jgi:hypothetical protein